MNDQLTWFKSSYSDDEGGDCLEVAFAQRIRIHIRDSKNPAGPRLDVAAAAWAAFVRAVGSGV
ncbi:DUF397 domain-containing protein [Streptomyces sp. NPDC001595]|uniref:DUF397 domain-containing protein n=1 Tax=Streptomyces sp. NPDC001532 TaxID=3154520 RepID=UPI0033262149